MPIVARAVGQAVAALYQSLHTMLFARRASGCGPCRGFNTGIAVNAGDAVATCGQGRGVDLTGRIIELAIKVVP